MKLKLSELKDQLTLAKSLPAGAARAQMLTTLKSAEVFDVDKDNKEFTVTVEIVDAEPTGIETKAATGQIIDHTATITKAVNDAIALATKDIKGLRTPGAITDKFTVPAECKSYRPKNFKGEVVNGRDGNERAFRFGMWLLGAKGNSFARDWCRENGVLVEMKQFTSELLQKLHSEGTNTAGGFLVPEEFGTDIIDLKETYGVARRVCGTIPMASDTRTDPRRTGGLTAYPVGEAAAGTESTASWDQVRLTAKDWMVLTRMTNQLGADAVISMADKLAYEIAYAHVLKEDQTVFTGTATSTYAGITGITQALTNKWTPATAGTINGITKASSTTLASLALADFENAVGSLPQYADTQNACWVVHRYIYQAVMLKLALAAGGVVSMEIANGNRQPRPKFLGYPVEFSQVLPSTTAATTVFALLGDFGLGCSFGDRQQDMITFSTEASVGGESVFERNETAVRGIARWDFVAHDVGDGTTPGPVVAVATG